MDSLRRLTPAELRSKIAEMARGPGQAPLAGRDLDAQVGLHAAFARGLPFLSLTSESGGRLGGEALRAKVVTARLGKQTIAAKVGDGHWEVAVPISWLQKPFLIVADGRASMTPESAFTSDVGIAHTSRKPGRGSRRL